MFSLRIESLDAEILSDFTRTITNCKDGNMPEEDDDIRELYSSETQTAGIKELAFMMNQLELSTICDNYLHVEYKEGANKKNRMMLSKRFIESFDNLTVEKWFKQCTDRDILTQLCYAMDLEITSKTTVSQMQQYCVEQVYEFGERVVLHRLSVDQLRLACKKIRVKGSQYTSSKNILINAIITGTDIPKPAARKVEITRKRPIGKATQTNELMQHYRANELHDWAAENGLKTSGSKKVLIERILAFNAGDTENTLADPNSTVGRPAKKAVKKATVPAKKPAAKKTETKKAESKKPLTKKAETKPAAKKTNIKKATKKAEKPVEEPEPMDVEEEEEEDAPEEEEEVNVEEEDIEEQEEEDDEEEEEVVEEEEKVEVDEEEENDEEMEVEQEQPEEEEAEEVEAPAEKEEEEEEADEEEEVFDEAAAQAAIDAERELRTVEPEKEEPEQEEEPEMSLSDPSESTDYPTDITGKLFALSALDGFTRNKKVLTKIIEANGGKVTSKLTSKVDVLITAKDSKAWKMASNNPNPAKRVFCAGEEYLTNFY